MTAATAAGDPDKAREATAIAHRPEHGRLAVALILREATRPPLVCPSKAPRVQKSRCASSTQTGLPYRGRQGLQGATETVLRALWRASPSPKMSSKRRSHSIGRVPVAGARGYGGRTKDDRAAEYYVKGSVKGASGAWPHRANIFVTLCAAFQHRQFLKVF